MQAVLAGKRGSHQRRAIGARDTALGVQQCHYLRSQTLILFTFWFGLLHSNFSLTCLCCPPHLLSQVIFYFMLSSHMTDICYVVRNRPAVSCDNLLISQNQVIFMEHLISSMSWTLGGF